MAAYLHLSIPLPIHCPETSKILQYCRPYIILKPFFNRCRLESKKPPPPSQSRNQTQPPLPSIDAKFVENENTFRNA